MACQRLLSWLWIAWPLFQILPVKESQKRNGKIPSQKAIATRTPSTQKKEQSPPKKAKATRTPWTQKNETFSTGRVQDDEDGRPVVKEKKGSKASKYLPKAQGKKSIHGADSI